MAGLFATTQSKVLGVLSLVALVLSFVVALRTDSWGVALGGLLIGGLIMLINLYDVNCVVLGGCDVWGWVKVALIGLLLLGVIAMQFTLLRAGRKIQSLVPTAAPTN